MGSDVNGNEKGVKGVLKNFVGIFLVLFVSLSFIAILASRKTEGSAAVTSTPENFRQPVLTGSSHSAPVKSDSVTANKRRVPSGPDPVHNRHVGENRRPAGRV